jgi:hypothetical protein
MKKKILGILVCMLLFATVSSVTVTANNEMWQLQDGIGISETLDPTQEVNNEISIQDPVHPAMTNRDDILYEGFEGTWEPDPDGDPTWMVPVDPTFGKWDIEGLHEDFVPGYPGLTWYWSQMEDADHPTLDLSPCYGTYWAGLWWDAVQDEWIITPEMDVSDYGDLKLTFWSAYTMMRYGASQTQHDYVKVSTDGGDNWDIVGDLTHDPEFDHDGCTGGPAGPGWNWCEVICEIDLSAYDESESLMIAWNYVYDGVPSAGVWLFDEVTLTGEIVIPPLVADADGPYEATEDDPIQFQGSAEGGVPPYSFHWDFGNGDTSDEEDPEYTYDEPGQYDVILTVTDDAQNTDDDETTATIHEKPCCFEVLIPTGFGIGLKAEATEICDESHTKVPWKFKITGGLFVMPISPLNGNVDFAAGETKTLQALLVIGIGSIQISFTISDDCDPTTVNAFIIGPFVIVS